MWKKPRGEWVLEGEIEKVKGTGAVIRGGCEKKNPFSIARGGGERNTEGFPNGQLSKRKAAKKKKRSKQRKE